MRADSLTVLKAHAGPLAKRVTATGEVIGFEAGRWFACHELPVSGFEALTRALREVSRYPRMAVIRGRPLPGINLERCLRRSDRARHGDDVTFHGAARCWIGIDVDSLGEPPGLDFRVEPEDGAEHVRGVLPEPFRTASCWWQATGSAGIKPGIRCRLWFWLSRAISDAEAKGWLQQAPVDCSIYQPVGLHYTSPPDFAAGAHDPMIRRQGVLRGEDDTVDVPHVLPVIERPSVTPVTFTGRDPADDDIAMLRAALGRSRVAREIWTGSRQYVDRSTRHFAFAAALARAGLRDADMLHAALVALDEHHGADLSKITRPGYAAGTIAAALAAD